MEDAVEEVSVTTTWSSGHMLAGTLIGALALIAASCGDAGETIASDAAAPTPTTSAPAATAPSSTTSSVATGELLTTTTATAPTTTAVPTSTTTTVLALTTTAAPTSTTTTSVVPALPSGGASATCVNGWFTPEPGTPLRRDPLDLMRRDMGLDTTDLFVVDEMRYFVGPEDLNVIEPRRDVERWYVKGYLEADPTFAGRWLVRRVLGNEAIAGVNGVAGYDTTGYEEGTWTTFSGGEGGDEPSAYPGIPGVWYGIPEDLIATFGFLHPEVVGCLAGT